LEITVKCVFGHGGVGKSRELFEEWKLLPNKKKAYMSHSHSFLERQAKRVPGSRHIYGLEKICPCLKEDFNPIIDRLHKLKFPNKFLCAVCQDIEAYPTDQCPYKKQFKSMPKTLFLPIEYAAHKVMPDYRPKIIAVDDCLLKIKKFPKKSEIEIWLKILPQNLTIKEYSLKELVEMDDKVFDDVLALLEEEFNIVRTVIIEQVKKNPNDPMLPRLKIVGEDLRVYRQYARIYGMKKQFARPYLFYLFDYVVANPKTKLIIIEALPKLLEFLKWQAERYEYETGNKIRFECREVKHKPPLPNSVIYRCYGRRTTAWYPTTTSVTTSKKMKQIIIKRIKLILNNLKSQGMEVNPAFVVPKGAEEDFKAEFPESKILHFGDLRGKNELEFNNPLFVVGTYNIDRKDLLKEFNDLWFPNNPVENDKLVDEKPHGGRYVYKDERLHYFSWLREGYEQYQAIMRCRPLNYPRKIYHFGEIPEELPSCIRRTKLWVTLSEGGGILEDRVGWLEEIVKKKGDIQLDTVIKFYQDKYGDTNVTRVRKKISELLNETDKIKVRLVDGQIHLIWKDNYN